MGLFDANPKIIGNVINDVEVMDVSNLNEYVKKENIDIGVICVNRENAQEVADSSRCRRSKGNLELRSYRSGGSG